MTVPRRSNHGNLGKIIANATLFAMFSGEHNSKLASRVLDSLRTKALYAGLVLYGTSFFLPAVSDLAMGHMPGWFCAWLSLWLWADREHASILLIFGALINPLAITYLLLRLFNKAPELRMVLTSVIFLFIPFTWLCLLTLKMGVLIGHVIWIVSLLLMVFSEAAAQNKFTPVKYGSSWMGLVFLLCGYYWAVTPSEALTTGRDIFFYKVAIDFKAPDACGRIGRNILSPISRKPGYEIAYWRSICYYDLAQSLDNPKLCSHVRPLRYLGKDGSQYSTANCRNKIPDPNPLRPGYPTQQDFIQFMQAGGFEKAAMEYRRSRYRDFPDFDVYEQARQDPEFVAALKTVPVVYDWRTAPHPASGPEYLISMYGSDRTDESFCLRISTGSTYQFPDGRTFSLRASCILHVMLNGGTGGCFHLPSVENSETVVSQYDSKESCEQSFRTGYYPDFGEKPDSRLVFFRDAAALEAAFKDLGYVPSTQVANAPQPTFDDYVQFFNHVAREGTPVQRSNFLRRAMSIK